MRLLLCVGNSVRGRLGMFLSLECNFSPLCSFSFPGKEGEKSDDVEGGATEEGGA